eukprot:CAMPEP_0177673250 /NCGR_PEP_ID=MMETSP0447-20121125/25831_1 /TAXON_ID=0 /ORGANISM="Stygamoeba regulata, Strain BSH-02190019" /LENGTH=1137 /DNA_ID=CAMNT_0019181085 /DNA_START=487 /DNA_END=3900 /DNA_ORIENTATION=+
MKILSQQELTEMFSNVKMIISFNQTLLKDLEEDQAKAETEQRVGKIFCGITPYLNMYKQFCSDQTQSLNTRKRLKDTNQQFSEFLEKQQYNPESKLLVLSDFLIKPLQRICKYPLLLERITKYTTKDHSDYQSLKDAIAMMEDVVSQIDERKQVIENLRRMIDVQSMFETEEFTVVEPGRKYVFETEIVLMMRPSGNVRREGKKRHMFVFSDVILIAGPARTKNKMDVRVVYLVEHCDFVELADALGDNDPEPDCFGFLIVEHSAPEEEPPPAPCVVVAPTAEDKKKWQTMLSDVKRDRLEALQLLPAAVRRRRFISKKFMSLDEQLSGSANILTEPKSEPFVKIKSIVGHQRSLQCLAEFKGTVWSADSTGLIRVWNPVSYTQSFAADTCVGSTIVSMLPVGNNMWCACESGLCILNEKGELIKKAGGACFSLLCQYPKSASVPQSIWVGMLNSIRIYDSESFLLNTELPSPDLELKGFTALAQVGDTIWSGCGVHIYVWDTANNQRLTKKIVAPGKIQCMASTEGVVWTGSDDQTIRVWRTSTFECVHVIEAHQGPVKNLLAFGPFFWSCSWDKTVKAWDTKSYKPIAHIADLHEDTISAILVVWSNKTQSWCLWTGSYDRTISVSRIPKSVMPPVTTEVDIKDSKFAKLVKRNDEGRSVRLVTPNAMHTVVWSTYSGGVVRLWDAQTLVMTKEITLPSEVIFILSVGPHMWVATVNQVHVMNDEGAIVKDIAVQFMCMCAVDSSVWLATSNSIQIFCGKKLELTDKFSVNVKLRLMVQVSDENVWGATSNTVSVYSIATHELTKTFKAHVSKINQIVPHEGTIWTCSNDKTIKVWDEPSAETLFQIQAHEGYVLGLAHFGTHVWSCSWDKLIKIWDVKTLKCVETLEYHQDAVNAIAGTWNEKMRNWLAWSGSSDKTLVMSKVRKCTLEIPRNKARVKASSVRHSFMKNKPNKLSSGSRDSATKSSRSTPSSPRAKSHDESRSPPKSPQISPPTSPTVQQAVAPTTFAEGHFALSPDDAEKSARLQSLSKLATGTRTGKRVKATGLVSAATCPNPTGASRASGDEADTSSILYTSTPNVNAASARSADSKARAEKARMAMLKNKHMGTQQMSPDLMASEVFKAKQNLQMPKDDK